MPPPKAKERNAPRRVGAANAQAPPDVRLPDAARAHVRAKAGGAGMGTALPRRPVGLQRSAKWLRAKTTAPEGAASSGTTQRSRSRSLLAALAHAQNAGKPVSFTLAPRADGGVEVVAQTHGDMESTEPLSPDASPTGHSSKLPGLRSRQGSPKAPSAGSPSRYAHLDRLEAPNKPFDPQTRVKTQSFASPNTVVQVTSKEEAFPEKIHLPWAKVGRVSMTPHHAFTRPRMNVEYVMNAVRNAGGYLDEHNEYLDRMRSRRWKHERVTPPRTPPMAPKPLAERKAISELQGIRAAPASDETTAWRDDEELRNLSKLWGEREGCKEHRVSLLRKKANQEFAFLEARARNHRQFVRWMQMEETHRLYAMARWDSAELIQRAWRAKIRARKKEERRLKREAEQAARALRERREAKGQGASPTPPPLMPDQTPRGTEDPREAIKIAVETLKRMRKARIKQNPEAHMAWRVHVHAVSNAIDAGLASEEWLQTAETAEEIAMRDRLANEDPDDPLKPRKRFWPGVGPKGSKDSAKLVDSFGSSQLFMQDIISSPNYRAMRKSKWFRQYMRLDD